MYCPVIAKTQRQPKCPQKIEWTLYFGKTIQPNINIAIRKKKERTIEPFLQATPWGERERKPKHRRVDTVRFHLYEVQNQTKLNYSNRGHKIDYLLVGIMGGLGGARGSPLI